MKAIYSFILLFVLAVAGTSQAPSQNTLDKQPSYRANYQFRALAEIGFLGVAAHSIQLGQNTTNFDYVKQGGQSTLFPTSRLSLEVDWKSRNTIIFLYQPLRLETEVVTREDILIDDVLFTEGTNLNLLYNFPFYRLSYLRHLRFKNERFSLAVGGTLQIRNTTIAFESANGEQRKITRNVGPVPALKVKGTFQQNRVLSLEFEIDGMYAPVSYLNGSDTEIIGSILDASIRQRLSITDEVDTFLNLRYLGGGAVGTSNDTSEVTDGFTENWLNTYTVTTGFSYEF